MNNKFYDLPTVLNGLFIPLEKYYLQLKAGQKEELYLEYIRHLYKYEEESLFKKPSGEVFRGKIIGLSRTGKLRIQSGVGTEEFSVKEIQFVE
ncbi:MAG: hypothetical protein HKN16_06835 [Saprospiraceae bacterium]|nr:hypothetical protein [Saprospiraceae bacterium]